MTPAEEASKRIILSRKTYHRYLAMIDAGVYPQGDLLLFDQEILHLNILANEHPDLAVQARSFVQDWKDLWQRVRAAMR